MDCFLYLVDAAVTYHTVPWHPAGGPSLFAVAAAAAAVVADAAVPAAPVAVAGSSTVDCCVAIVVDRNRPWCSSVVDCDRRDSPFRGRDLTGTGAVDSPPLDRACPYCPVADSSAACSFVVAVGSFACRVAHLRVAVADLWPVCRILRHQSLAYEKSEMEENN